MNLFSFGVAIKKANFSVFLFASREKNRPNPPPRLPSSNQRPTRQKSRTSRSEFLLKLRKRATDRTSPMRWRRAPWAHQARPRPRGPDPGTGCRGSGAYLCWGAVVMVAWGGCKAYRSWWSQEGGQICPDVRGIWRIPLVAPRKKKECRDSMKGWWPGWCGLIWAT